MINRSTRVDVTIVASAVALVAALFGQAAAYADVAEAAPLNGSRLAKLKHTPPHTRVPTTDGASLYACHPKDDLSCTVIRETAKGIVVVTFRPTGAKETRVWSVVNAPAQPGSGSTGGTIYVVPGAARPVSDVQPPTQFSDNGAPILD
jgi:hypothetical protein